MVLRCFLFYRRWRIKIGAVILAGGKSRRMGTNKASLSYEGQSFLERITKELACFDEIILSTGDNMQYKELLRHSRQQVITTEMQY